MSEAAWNAIRPNIMRVDDAQDWWSVIEGPVHADVAADDRPYLQEAARIAATLNWAGDPWHELTGALKETTGRKGKPLFLPLRIALTGRDHGPDMSALLPLIGRERSIARLTA